MADAPSIASRIAQLMAKKVAPPEAEAAATPPPSTLTPEYKDKNKADIAKTVGYKPENDYNSKIKKFFGLSD